MSPLPNGQRVAEQPIPLERYPHDPVEAVLRFAFAMQVKRIDRVQSFSIHGTSPSDLTMHERIAEGMMLRRACLGCLGVRGRRVILAEYTVPSGETIQCKRRAVHVLGALLHVEVGAPAKFMRDVARQWAGMQRHRDPGQWAGKLQVSSSKIGRWIVAGRGLLDKWSYRAKADIYVELLGRGVIGR